MTKKQAKKKIDEFAEFARGKIQGDNSDTKMIGLLAKALAAVIVDTDNTENPSDVQILAGEIVDKEIESRDRSETTDSMLKGIFNKFGFYLSAVAEIEGFSSKAHDIIDATSSAKMDETVAGLLEAGAAKLKSYG